MAQLSEGVRIGVSRVICLYSLYEKRSKQCHSNSDSPSFILECQFTTLGGDWIACFCHFCDLRKYLLILRGNFDHMTISVVRCFVSHFFFCRRQ